MPVRPPVCFDYLVLSRRRPKRPARAGFLSEKFAGEKVIPAVKSGILQQDVVRTR